MNKPESAKQQNEREPTAAEVADYLRRHPDFLQRHPGLLTILTPPSRYDKDGVVDLQQAMLERLQGELQAQKRRYLELIATSRNNLSVQSRVHECVLAMMTAPTFEHLIEHVTTDLAVKMNVDAVVLCIEGEERDLPRVTKAGVRVLEAGAVDRLLGSDRDVLLEGKIYGEPEIFGPAARLVRSDALLRIKVSPRTPVGILGLGSRRETMFQRGQATEYLKFLARFIERSIRSWLDLPA